MKKRSEAAIQTFPVDEIRFRRPSYLLGAEAFVHPSKSDDEIRLQKVLKRAVERESVPQSLIDAIKASIRN